MLVGGRSAQATNGRHAIVAAVAAILLIALGGAAAQAAAPGADFRVSAAGGDDGGSRGANDPAIAYNSTDNQYLVVWEGDGGLTNNEFEVWGRLVSGTGDPIGADFQISTTGPADDPTRFAGDPSVAYNSTLNEYLVVWEGDGLPDLPGPQPRNGEFEIFGQRISAAGAELGSDFRISTVGTDVPPPNNTARTGLDPAVAYNPQGGEYLVVWWGDGFPAQAGNNDFEIFGQRVAANGAEVGGDFPISNVVDPVNPQSNPILRAGLSPAIACCTQSGRYLVVWYADPLATDDEFEIFGQLLSTTAQEVGANDFRISNVGPDGASLRGPDVPPAVAANPAADEFLVTWAGDHLVRDEFEISGQRVSGAAGTEVGGDFRISNIGADGDTGRGAFFSSVAHSPQANDYLVTWYGEGMATDEEIEICGQKLSASGAEQGGDVRISTTGADGDTLRGAFFPAAAAGTSDYLTVWSGDGLAAADDEFEIFGDRFSSTEACTGSGGGVKRGPPGPGPGGGTTPPPPVNGKTLKLRVSVAKTQRLVGRTISMRVTCDQACRLTASSRVSVPGASKTFRLATLRRTLTRARTVTLKIKFSSKAARAVRSALKKRKRVSTTVNLTARITGGDPRTSKRVIRIKR